MGSGSYFFVFISFFQNGILVHWGKVHGYGIVELVGWFSGRNGILFFLLKVRVIFFCRPKLLIAVLPRIWVRGTEESMANMMDEVTLESMMSILKP
jgi:hypothetical protein